MSEYIVSDMSYYQQFSKCEEIVRCRDCKHYDPHLTEGGVCFLPDGDGDFARWEVEPDGYCAWGERRSDEG